MNITTNMAHRRPTTAPPMTAENGRNTHQKLFITNANKQTESTFSKNTFMNKHKQRVTPCFLYYSFPDKRETVVRPSIT